MKETVVSFSDPHAGSTLGPCPKPIRLDEGGWYTPGPEQLWLNQKLDLFWDRVEAARGDTLGVFLNGDLLDGQVKGSAQVISPHPHVEFAVLKDILARMVSLKPDWVMVTRGTGAHVGLSGAKDEAAGHYLAKECGLPVIQNADTGKYSHYIARKQVHGSLLWATHHGKVGSVAWSNVIANRALHIWVERQKRGLDCAKVLFQAHNHKFDDSYWKHPLRIVQQGAFQLMTDYAHKVVSMEVSDVGGVLAQVEPNGRPEVEHIRFYPDEPRVY